jgi:dTDP-4-dehydrorhamnose 3,5-epimerase
MRRASCSINGVVLHELVPHVDDRGQLTEIHRESWASDFPKVQWNCVQSRARVLRGVHVHPLHFDYLFVGAGSMLLGLHDIRPDSATLGVSEMITLEASKPVGVAIPPGVCHGFYFPVPSVLVYAVSEYWSMADELGCRFDAPELKLNWPDHAPLLSPRDVEAVDYPTMVAAYRRAEAEAEHRAAP